MNQKVFDIVSTALTTLNEELMYDSFESITVDTGVMSGEDAIDSLTLVRLIVMLEGEIEQEFGTKPALAEQISVEEATTPFRTVGTIVALIESRLPIAA